MLLAQTQSKRFPKAKILLALLIPITGLLVIVISLMPGIEWAERQDAAVLSTQSATSETSLSIGNDGTAIVVGPVVENVKKCTVDLSCFLKLKFHDEEIHVLYVTSEGDRCINEQASRQGLEVKKDHRIEALGQYNKQGKLHILSTCPSKAFYIKVLSPSQ